MSRFIQAPNPIIPGQKKDSIYVFLAGPIQGVHDWQKNDVPDLGEGVTVISPRRESLDKSTFDWNEQVDWETKALRVSDYVLFWIPPEEEKIEGRDYAQTTKIELMENLARGKRIILGIHPEIHTRRYLVHKAEEYRLANSGLYAVHDNLEDCIKELKERIKSDLETTDRSVNTFFTSDTHFGSERTLELSVRPFKNVEEMDWTMIERWNQVVRPNSKVYHLGDFGNLDMVKYLNGQILLVLGNYEKKDIQEKYDGDVKKYGEVLCEKGFDQFSDEPFETDLYTSFEDSQKITLGHEPIATNNARLKFGTKYALFGHIHGRQRIKPFGLDVGVDTNNFTPCRASKEIRFFLNALDKGYYDEEVWVQ